MHNTYGASAYKVISITTGSVSTNNYEKDHAMAQARRLQHPCACIYYNFIRKHIGAGNRNSTQMARIVVRGISGSRTRVQNWATTAYFATWQTYGA